MFQLVSTRYLWYVEANRIWN